MFTGVLASSILARAQEKDAISVDFVNLRDFGVGPRKQVDDTPYGGGAGMVLRVDVMAAAIDAAKHSFSLSSSNAANLPRSKAGDPEILHGVQNDRPVKIILMTPQGKRLVQPTLRKMADFAGDYIIVCGHYEGFDERIRSLVDAEISIGDFVLTGGEVPAMILVDGIARLLPGVLGSEASHMDETHSVEGRIEYPHYTRPDVFDDQSVPDVLKSGNHADIAKWRESQSAQKSK